MTDGRLLGIYLNDHLAGAISGQELAKRCLSSNRESGVGSYLDTFVAEVRADESVLREVMAAVGVAPSPIKQAAGWAAEKVARLKLNGQLTGYSPLSRLIELEGLWLGVLGKRALWRSLKILSSEDRRLSKFDFEGLEKRASAQATKLERFRLEVARSALA